MIDALGKKHSEKPCNTIDTLVGVKTLIKGDITFTGGLRIDGKVEGNIVGKGDKSSTLVISEHAEVQGNVTVPHLVVNGTIRGNVYSAETTELQPKAEIIGEVHYKMLEMALGASINGNLVHETAAADKGAVHQLKPVANAGETEQPS